MIRFKRKDLNALDEFLQTLSRFKKLKMATWEKVDDRVQASIHPGSPTEDWIIPPDEGKTEKILNEDPLYRELRSRILSCKNQVKEISKFLGVNSHHNLDWLNFSSPLIGNAALDESIAFGTSILEKCHKSSYIKLNLENFYRKIR